MTTLTPTLLPEHPTRRNHHYFIIGQIVFLLFIGGLLYYNYPHVDYVVNGNVVKFSSLNSDTIIISTSEDFSAPRYITFEKKDVFVNLEPGVYYWKPVHSFMKGWTGIIEIPPEVGVVLNNNQNNSNATIENVGNVKIKVSKTQDGVMVGHIILEPEENESVENKGRYKGEEL